MVKLVKKIIESSYQKFVFFDIGAFIGFYSILAGKLGCRVYSFELVEALDFTKS